MRFEILSGASGIEAAWWNLWHRDPGATPFQTPAWLLPWRRHFGDGEGAVLAIHGENGRLDGLLPLFTHGGRLLLWGAGTSDRLDGLFDPSLPLAVLSEAVGRLSLPLDLFQLRTGSPLRRMPASAGWRDQTGASEDCLVLELPARLGRTMTQNLRYYGRRARRSGVREPEAVTSSEFGALHALHTRRWNERGEPGIFADPRVASWLGEALPLLERAGLLRLYAVRTAWGEPLAVICLLCHAGRSFYYIGGFDPDHAALGLGTILLGHAIAEAERHGHAAFDFLRGHEPYKYRWGAREQRTHARILTPPGRSARR